MYKQKKRFTFSPAGAAWRALLAITTLCYSLHGAALKPLDRIVAIVNEDVVMETELREQTERYYMQMQRQQQPLPPQDTVVKQMLDKLILDRIQLAMGDRAGVKISDEEVNNALRRSAEKQGLTLEQFVTMAHQDGLTLDSLRKSFRRDMTIGRVQQGMVRRRIDISDQEVDQFLGSEEGQFMASPELQVGHLLLPLPSAASQEQIEAITAQASALRAEAEAGDFRQIAIAHSAGPRALQGGDLGWRRAAQLPSLFGQALEQMEPGQISPPLRSDAGIHLLKLYERRGSTEHMVRQHQVRHILVKTNQIRDEQATRDFAAQLRQRIANGEDFGELAREHSEDTGSALKGGELGWSSPGQFVPEFELAVGELAVGSVSSPVLTQFGWHLIEVTARRDQDLSEEMTRNQARNVLGQRKYAEELQIWLQEIRNDAFVELRL